MRTMQTFSISQSRVKKSILVATRMQDDICQCTSTMHYRTTHTMHGVLAHEVF